MRVLLALGGFFGQVGFLRGMGGGVDLHQMAVCCLESPRSINYTLFSIFEALNGIVYTMHVFLILRLSLFNHFLIIDTIIQYTNQVTLSVDSSTPPTPAPPPKKSPHPSLSYPFFVIFFPCFRCPFSLSLSKNFLCSSPLIPLTLASLTSFFFLSPSRRRSSAFSSSSALRSLRDSSSRVWRVLRWTSGRKWAVWTRVSGRRRKVVKRRRVGGGVWGLGEGLRRRERERRLRGVVSESLGLF